MSVIEQTLHKVLHGLMKRYKERVPDVSIILNALVEEKVINSPFEIENDHIAFRTLGVPHLGIASLEKVFLHYRYTKKDKYFFPEKKLDAYWYAPANPKDPRIFISELRVKDLSLSAQRLIHSYTNEISTDPVDGLNLDNADLVDKFLHSGLWRLPSWKDYQALAKENEYAAWTIYNRYYLNHFTISVHNLKAGYNTVPEFNAFLERLGILLNNSSGKVKTSPDGGLLQSATVAQTIEAAFADGDLHLIPGSYVEFAERKILPEYQSMNAEEITRQHRREGFEAANADKIFESTYAAQTDRARS
ncbi:MAG TPA: DUF1338 domain-containing protein [Flavitalea sp.]|nr:DUF1338 domain-containing protein [Flavitalea sp.]